MFDQKQVESMEILANQIAIALEKVYLYHKVQKMSIMDGLTGLYVHRYMQEKLDNELKRASRYGNNLSLIIGDIDYFKDINDTYGHIAGDYILKNIALLLKNSTSPVDTVARYGGEEFVVIMPEADKENAADTAEKIRREIEKYPFRFGDNDIKVTMSFGVGSFPGDAMVKRSLIEKADAALYKAKESGRNKVITA
ncbi:MAG: GGDEF domain-containing protein, partial [bacterium]